MLVADITPELMDRYIAQGDLIFIDFWAVWCAPCKQFSVVYERIANEYPEIIFAKVNIEQQPAIAETLEIRSIPHVMIFKFGTLIFSESGSMPESRLRELVKQAQQIKAGQIVSQDN